MLAEKKCAMDQNKSCCRALVIRRVRERVAFFSAWKDNRRAYICDRPLIYCTAIMRFATPGAFLHHGSGIIPSSLARSDPPWKPAALPRSFPFSLLHLSFSFSFDLLLHFSFTFSAYVPFINTSCQACSLDCIARRAETATEICSNA